jgi:ABC-type multidrug transport system ATPase subunit
LEIEAGEAFALIGKAGSGKSTLLNLLAGYSFPMSGRVRIFENEVGKPEVKKWTGYVPEDVRAYPNITPLKLFYYTAALYGINDVDYILFLAERFELSMKRRDPMRRLNDEERKKTAIITALLPKPQLLILDAPTKSLSTRIKYILFDVLEELNHKGVSILVSGTDTGELDFGFTQMAVLQDGLIGEVHSIGRQALQTGEVKKVTILCKNIPFGVLKQLGGESVRLKDGKILFDYVGEINALLRALSKYDVEDIVIMEQELSRQAVFQGE